MLTVVRCKLFTPGQDNFGTKWKEVSVDSYGVGQAVFNVHRPARWTKFRVATRTNDRIIQENAIRPSQDRRPWEEADGIEAEPGDVITVDFVVHELAFRVRVNDDLDDEDEMTLRLLRLHDRYSVKKHRNGQPSQDGG